MTIPPEKVSALLVRVKGAGESSAELDAAIGAAVGVIGNQNAPITEWGVGALADGYSWLPLRASLDGRMVQAWVCSPEGKEYFMYARRPDPFTSSLDAAIALVERVYPTGSWCVEKLPGTDLYGGQICLPCVNNKVPSWASNGRKTPALALITALLESLSDGQ
jgi:hypothetical protein